MFLVFVFSSRQAEYFPAFENSENGAFRIAFFSATPTEVEAFKRGNKEFSESDELCWLLLDVFQNLERY